MAKTEGVTTELESLRDTLVDGAALVAQMPMHLQEMAMGALVRAHEHEWRNRTV